MGPAKVAPVAAHRVPGRAYASTPRHRYGRPLGDQITSIEARFDFSVQRLPGTCPESLKYPHVRPQMQSRWLYSGAKVDGVATPYFWWSGLSPPGSGNSASRWPLQLKLGDRRHAHMSSSDAEFQRKRPAGRAAFSHCRFSRFTPIRRPVGESSTLLAFCVGTRSNGRFSE